MAFADVRDSLVAACRVHAPLEALRRNGLIDDYVVTDATLRGAARRGLFDVVWLQRGADAALARLVASRLPGRFLLDVDDHLLCTPSYLKPGDLPSADALTVSLVMHNPLIFLQVLSATLDANGLSLAQMTYGILGWLTVGLPMAGMVVAALAVILLLGRDEPITTSP